MPMNMAVLLVEDDVDLRITLQEVLQVEGYRVHTAGTLAEARDKLKQYADTIGIVLLDLGLPDGQGDDLLAQLRKEGELPVLVISAQGSEHSKVGLFDAGADDYLVKPFSMDELLARMRATLRHRGIINTAAGPANYKFGDITIDMRAWRVEKAGEQVHLTPTEFNLLARLVRSAGQVVTHHQLLVDVWGPEFRDHTHYLRLYMAQLRNKLEKDPARPQLLHTETGVGYRLQESAD